MLSHTYRHECEGEVELDMVLHSPIALMILVHPLRLAVFLQLDEVRAVVGGHDHLPQLAAFDGVHDDLGLPLPLRTVLDLASLVTARVRSLRHDVTQTENNE